MLSAKLQIFNQIPNVKVLWQAATDKSVIFLKYKSRQIYYPPQCDLDTGLGYLIGLRPDSHM